jgi:hypothetical protein
MLRDQLLGVLTWEAAHVGFETAVKRVPRALRGIRPKGMPYSLWQLVEHLRLAQRDILDFCRDPGYRAPKWPDDYWPDSPQPSSDVAWRRSLAAYRADLREVEALVSAPGFSPYARIPHGDGQTYLREVLLIADHTAYHVGEIVAVRRALGAWK